MSLLFTMRERGRDFEGSDLIRFLRESAGLRWSSRSTAWSRPRSRRNLGSATVVARRGAVVTVWRRRRSIVGEGGGWIRALEGFCLVKNY